MFNFDYSETYPCLSYELINEEQKKSNLNYKEKCRKQFKENGLFVYKINFNDENIFTKFNEILGLVGKNIVRDATRRSKVNASSKDIKLSVVDPDLVHRPHSETSFSPARPAVIGFVCSEIDNEASSRGLTTIIDGFQFWKDLSISTKNILLSGEIEYRLSIDTPSIKKIPRGKRPWFLEYNGVKNVELDGDNKKINFDYKTSFVTEHPINRNLCIANHSFIDIKTEPQILNRIVKLDLFDSKVLNFLREDINSSLNNNIYTFRWQKGLALVLDNYRYMHGRLPYDLNLKRKINITQLRNFI